MDVYLVIKDRMMLIFGILTLVVSTSVASITEVDSDIDIIARIAVEKGMLPDVESAKVQLSFLKNRPQHLERVKINLFTRLVKNELSVHDYVGNWSGSVYANGVEIDQYEIKMWLNADEDLKGIVLLESTKCVKSIEYLKDAAKFNQPYVFNQIYVYTRSKVEGLSQENQPNSNKNCEFSSSFRLTFSSDLLKKSIMLKLDWPPYANSPRNGELYASIESKRMAKTYTPFGSLLKKQIAAKIKYENKVKRAFSCEAGPFCEVKGGYYYNAIYNNDWESLKIVQDKVYRKLEDFGSDYLYAYKKHFSDCLELDAKEVVVSKRFETQNGYGQTLDADEFYVKYKVNKNLLPICKTSCNYRSVFGSEAIKQQGLQQIFETYKCDSPEIKIFEEAMLKIWDKNGS